MSSFDDDSLIVKNQVDEHRVSKFEFRPITSDEKIVQSSPKEATPTETAQLHIDHKAIESSIEKELIEKLLQKTDELSSSLAKLQIQFEKHNQKWKSRLILLEMTRIKMG
ncbi:hypothetical protein [Helicobacter fennelliae]|uniref:Flagellar assembly protein FliH n=1 Tax=Helicobacter fennelliae MRY12-0050 TaxID=1325130 RepID=T1DWK8_9HELI|nr:hypothetical protein [Helicobacter fennelliae]GAD19497.1 flagellar assembly protein FliH [Helicobacter fennelliae MRY12-0050]